MKFFKLLLLMLVYFSIATIIAEAALLGTLYARGNLSREQFFQFIAVAHNVDLYSMWKRMEAASRPIDEAQVSYQDVVTARRRLMLDYDLREMAVDKGHNDMRQLDSTVTTQRERYLEIRTDFERRLEQARQGEVDQAVLDVQRQLEPISPKLAKDQLVRILDDPSLDPDSSLQFVVTIVKALPLDKRKKILSEFKDEDTELLHEILKQVRLGVPDVALIRETRSQLQQFLSQD